MMFIIDANQKTFHRFLLANDRNFLFYPRTREKCVEKESVLLMRSHPCRTLRDINNCRPHDYRAISGNEGEVAVHKNSRTRDDATIRFRNIVGAALIICNPRFCARRVQVNFLFIFIIYHTNFMYHFKVFLYNLVFLPYIY